MRPSSQDAAKITVDEDLKLRYPCVFEQESFWDWDPEPGDLSLYQPDVATADNLNALGINLDSLTCVVRITEVGSYHIEAMPIGLTHFSVYDRFEWFRALTPLEALARQSDANNL